MRRVMRKDQNHITVSTSGVLINREPFHMKGDCWNGTSVDEAVADSEAMESAGINTILPATLITDKAVLDAFLQRGIRILSPLEAELPLHRVSEVVSTLRHHPAILMWTVVSDLDSDDRSAFLGQDRARVAARVDLAKRLDFYHPVSVALGGLPDAGTMQVLEQVDMWGVNVCADGKPFKAQDA